MKKQKYDMKPRYDIKAFQICPFEKVHCGPTPLVHPLRNEGYGFVLCVCDFKNNRVIEIANGHSYKYIELVSGFMLNKERIIHKKRYAICPVYVSLMELSKDEIKRAEEIMKKLDDDSFDNPLFIDGNYVLTNEEYRESIDQYNELKKQKNKKRVKKHEHIRYN